MRNMMIECKSMTSNIELISQFYKKLNAKSNNENIVKIRDN